MNANKQERAASVVLTVFSLAYLVFAFLIPMPVLKQQLGPDGFPKAIGCGMLALSLIYVYQQFRGGAREDKETEERAAIIGAEEKIEGKADRKTMAFILAAMLFYAISFERLGYAVSTFLVFTAGVLYLDRRHLARDLLIAAIASFALNYLFSAYLRVKLPAGPLDFLGW
jgi:putative tricarboxylic transport membrane protein